jgi:hypothetical protein
VYSMCGKIQRPVDEELSSPYVAFSIALLLTVVGLLCVGCMFVNSYVLF